MNRSKESPRIVIHTELGDVELELFSSKAPVTVANFLKRIEHGTYSSGCFYRVVHADNQPNDPILIDVIQGGIGFKAYDFKQAGIAHETTEDSGIKHKNGVISMARLATGTASTEFFICVGDQPELDFGGRRNPDGHGFAAFGQVMSGMEIVRQIHQSSEGNQALTPNISFSNIERLL